MGGTEPRVFLFGWYNVLKTVNLLLTLKNSDISQKVGYLTSRIMQLSRPSWACFPNRINHLVLNSVHDCSLCLRPTAACPLLSHTFCCYLSSTEIVLYIHFSVKNRKTKDRWRKRVIRTMEERLLCAVSLTKATCHSYFFLIV